MLPGEYLSPAVQYIRLRKNITREFDLARKSRNTASAAFSSTHQNILFNRVLEHISRTIKEPFNFIRAARLTNELRTDYLSHVENFLSLTRVKEIPTDAVYSFIASSILIDTYPPNIHSGSHLLRGGDIKRFNYDSSIQSSATLPFPVSIPNFIRRTPSL